MEELVQTPTNIKQDLIIYMLPLGVEFSGEGIVGRC